MKKRLVVLQDGNKECGSACLLSVLRYYGGNIGIERLVELTKTSKNGTSFYNIAVAAKALGLLSKAYKITNIDYFINLNCPSICQINVKNYTHFVVVYKVKNNYVKIMDPARGMVDMRMDEFIKRWTGNIMIFKPNKRLINYKEERIINNIIEDVFVNNQKVYLLIVFVSLLYTIMTCVYSYYMKISIDKVINGSYKNLLFVTIVFLFIVIVRNVANFIRNNLLIFVNEKMEFLILNTVYKKILLLPYSYFYNHHTGDIISRITAASDVKRIVNKITITVLLDGVVLIVGGFILYGLNSTLFGVLIVSVIIYLILLFIFRPILKKYTNDIQENNANLSNFLVESISSFDTIKGLNVESVMSNKLEKLSIYNIENVSKYERILNIQLFLKDMIYYVTMIFIMYIGTKFVIDKELSLTNFLTFNAMLVYFMDPIRNIIDLHEDFQYLINSIKRVNSIFMVKSINLDSKDDLVVTGDILIKNLTFSFNDYDIVLNNISLSFSNNEKVLIMGPSGSGKSSLLKILMKYYSVKRDVVFVNGIDISDYSYSTIKSNFSYISQNELIYTDTIKNNICLNRVINDSLFINICRICCVDEIIKDCFLGYDTILEENGHNLSGGQRQRIILARCLVNNSRILLIDEGLNQLDVNLERKILKELFKENKTIIVVSHRIDNMDLYDKVVKLKKGEVDVVLDKKSSVYE